MCRINISTTTDQSQLNILDMTMLPTLQRRNYSGENKQFFYACWKFNRTTMKLRPLFKIIILLLPCFYFQIAPAQEHVHYNNIRVKKEINNILTSRPDIDSIHLQFFQNKPSRLKVYEQPSVVKNKVNRNKNYFYDLSFEGDQLLLAKDFPSIKKLLDEDVAKAIKKPDSMSNFRLVVGRNYAKLRDSVPIYQIYPRIPERERKDLQDFLTSKYSESPGSFGKDSVLLLQGEVDRGGKLGQVELLSGNKGALYTFFLDNYAYYVENVFGKTTRSSHKSLILPAILSGKSYRALIDIYVRLNPNNTISIPSNGVQRILRIKNYKDNEAEPLIWF